MFGTILLAIVFFILISNQNKKIEDLEKKIDGLAPRQHAKQEAAVGSQPQVSESPIATPLTVSSLHTQSAQSAPLTTTKNTEQYQEESSGKLLGKIGIGALILGVAFFLKYAFDNNWVGPSGRIVIGVIIGLLLISIGQHLRKKYETFSEVMFGGGIAILYLSFFSAHYFYNLITSSTAGILMFITTVITFILSFLNKDNKLAVIAIIGGFATPYLIGTTGNNMAELFGYLSILNIGVLAINLFKKWPYLVGVALVGTAINFITWFGGFYEEQFLGTVVLFLVITFAIFLVANIYRIIVQKVKSDAGDYFLLLANAFGFFGIFYHIMKPMHENMLGFYTLVIALVYIAVAYVANKNNPEDKDLNIVLPGLAVTFLSIAVPVQFSGATIAYAWFIEACLLYFIALSISNRGFQVMGVVVYCLGLINFFFWNSSIASPEKFVVFMNTPFGILLVAIVSAYIIAYIYYKYGSTSVEIQKRGIAVFVIVANLLTLYALSTQITNYYHAQSLNSANQEMQYANNAQIPDYGTYMSGNAYQQIQTQQETIKNKSNTLVSILWALYAAILTAVGFAKRSSTLRLFGLVLFILTAFKVVIDVWSLGQLYRIISFIGLGVVALIASFVYAKYKDRLKTIS